MHIYFLSSYNRNKENLVILTQYLTSCHAQEEADYFCGRTCMSD